MGNNTDFCWRMGTGEFKESIVTTELILVPDQEERGRHIHGTVSAARLMPIGDFSDALTATRPDWIVDEE